MSSDAYAVGIRLALRAHGFTKIAVERLTAYEAGQQPIPANPFRQRRPLAWRVQSYFQRPSTQAGISKGFERAGEHAKNIWRTGGTTVYLQSQAEREEAARRETQRMEERQRALAMRRATPEPQPQPQAQPQPQRQYPGTRSVPTGPAPVAYPQTAPPQKQVETAKASPAKAMTTEQALTELEKLGPVAPPTLEDPSSVSSIRG